MSKYTSEEMAKILFPQGLPGTNMGWEDAQAYLSPEQKEQIRKEVERMESKLNIKNEDINRDDCQPAEFVNPVPAPIPGINVPPPLREPVNYQKYPASEVPDAATKAFIRELNREPQSERQSAHGFLDEASNTMKQRAALRDAEGGERTAAQIAKVFNAITGHDISEEDAWMFLIVLKIVRSRNGKYNRDDYVDLAAYSALLGECESEARKV